MFVEQPLALPGYDNTFALRAHMPLAWSGLLLMRWPIRSPNSRLKHFITATTFKVIPDFPQHVFSFVAGGFSILIFPWTRHTIPTSQCSSDFLCFLLFHKSSHNFCGVLFLPKCLVPHVIFFLISVFPWTKGFSALTILGSNWKSTKKIPSFEICKNMFEVLISLAENPKIKWCFLHVFLEFPFFLRMYPRN